QQPLVRPALLFAARSPGLWLFLFVGFLVGHFFAAFFGVDSEIRVGVGDDKAINTAKLLGGGSVAPQPASNRPKTHAAHFFSFPVLLLASSAITSPPSSRF